MAGTNSFLPFATGGGANVITDAAYAALAAKAAGFSSGVAASNQLNKVWRQSSVMSAVLGQIIANNNTNATDSDSIGTLVLNLLAGIYSAPIVAGTANGVAYLNGSKVLTSGNALVFDGTNLTVSGRINGNGAEKAGMVAWFAMSTPPTGFVAANGAAVSRTTYATLFAAIGTTFGVGDGSTTFNVPDLRDRMPMGSGNLYALAATGGSKDAVVVSHTHTITDPGHLHTVPASGTQAVAYGSGGDLAANDAASTTGSSTTGITIANTGVSGTNANLPPYVGLLACIKY